MFNPLLIRRVLILCSRKFVRYRGVTTLSFSDKQSMIYFISNINNINMWYLELTIDCFNKHISFNYEEILLYVLFTFLHSSFRITRFPNLITVLYEVIPVFIPSKCLPLWYFGEYTGRSSCTSVCLFYFLNYLQISEHIVHMRIWPHRQVRSLVWHSSATS